MLAKQIINLEQVLKDNYLRKVDVAVFSRDGSCDSVYLRYGHVVGNYKRGHQMKYDGKIVRIVAQGLGNVSKQFALYKWTIGSGLATALFSFSLDGNVNLGTYDSDNDASFSEINLNKYDIISCRALAAGTAVIDPIVWVIVIYD